MEHCAWFGALSMREEWSKSLKQVGAGAQNIQREAKDTVGASPGGG